MLYTEITYSFCSSIEHNGILQVCFGATICATFEAGLVWVYLALDCEGWGSEASKLYTFFVSSITSTVIPRLTSDPANEFFGWRRFLPLFFGLG